jgi:2-oxo-4-hydroxy-4-carboxy-5-ureidoimidazoline decarboxylase
MGALLAARMAARESVGMSADELARFNALSVAAAREELLACCNSLVWADRMAAGRPYSSARDAVRQSSAIMAMLSIEDLRAALAGHARIGEPPPSEPSPSEPASEQLRGDGARGDQGRSRSAEWSRAEQSGVLAADQQTASELAASNLEYERRFGHIYLVSASGRTGRQLLDLLRARLRNSQDTEWQVVRTELQKINEGRLVKLLSGTP